MWPDIISLEWAAATGLLVLGASLFMQRVRSPGVAGHAMLPAEDLRGEIERLRHELAQCHAMLGTVEDVLYLAAADLSRYEFISPAAEQIFGRPLGELSESPLLLREAVFPEDRGLISRALAVLAEEGEAEVRYRFLRADGSVRWAAERMSRSVLGAGLVSGMIRDVTGLIEAETELRLKERALASISSGVVISDMRSKEAPVIYVNKAFERITGFVEDEILGRNCSLLQGDAPYPEEQTWVLDEIRRIIAAGGSGKVTILNYRKGGEPFWNELQLSPIVDETGRVTHYIGVQNDISPYVENMQALTKSEQRLALTIDALHEGIWDWDMTSNGLITSPSWARILGLSPSDYTAPHVIDTLSERLPEQWYRPFFRAIHAHVDGETEDLNIEHEILRADGQVIWVNTHGKVVERAPDGQPLRMVGSMVDITDRINSAERIIALMTQLDVILTLTPDGIAHFDEEGRVSFVNFAFERLTGIKAGDVSGLSQDAFVELLQARADTRHRFPDLLGSTSLHGGDERRLIYMQRPRVAVLQISWHSPSVGNSVVVYLRDVTHETEVDRMKTEFLSTAAHELRTPMASIMGFAELLMLKEFAPERTRDMLGTIHRQAKRLTVLINELLDLARIEARAGKDFNLRISPLAPVIHEAVNAFSNDFDQGRIQLQLPEQLPELRIDTAKLQQALINLLSNAYKYSPQGGAIEVGIETRERDGHPEIGVRVRDHGIGMTEEQCGRVFERFYRADPSGNIPGTGLGMSLVKEVVEAMGGGVSLHSEPGRGTTVILWLRCDAAALEDSAAAPATLHPNRTYGELTLWEQKGSVQAQ